jgi:D-glycero-alpha-D-manno-heptose-7-phosphate kinase
MGEHLPKCEHRIEAKVKTVSVIEVSVPVRICDIGGWTDTWFGGPGRVVNIGVGPGITVSVRAGSQRAAQPRLVEAALELVPPPVEVDVVIASAIPPGSGAGTSAAVAVALLAALSTARGESRSPYDLAYLAHHLEVEVLGNESGIQDQLAAAYGGINFLEIETYPHASVQALPPWPDLGSRLSLVYLGRPHHSSSIHRDVIDTVARQESVFDLLRDAACRARDAVFAQDLGAFGRAMIANTNAQRALHTSLIGVDATKIFEDAAQHQALGWKVNGAGGNGGSVTILHASPAAKLSFDEATSYEVLPVGIEGGLRVHGSL